uniref:Photosystem I assembly protein Ycf4 n=1 Tax=Phacus inflexus TaxID=461210 RepID=A0A3G3LKS7_9EUGL|nr:photosystem I assembly protein ycf4 [Phacus inflexus]AYQ93310.1 photosystem I assembly protein ycf4 [Phacus inflexus]
MEETFSKKSNLSAVILREEIENKQILTDYVFSSIILLGSLGFLITGISSFFKYNFIFFLNADRILFFPQGITMCFYGSVGLLISISQFLILYWKIGNGYNEINKEKGTVEIYRKGYPGKNSEVKLIYEIKDIEAIKIETNSSFFNSKQTIYICLKQKVDIPIIQVRNPINLNEIEKKASEIASFLKVPLKEN